jgi:hypothetical protein
VPRNANVKMTPKLRKKFSCAGTEGRSAWDIEQRH